MGISNEVFKEVVCEVACLITTERFGEETWVHDKESDCFSYTEHAQDFFNEKYDEIELMLIDRFKIKINYE